MVVYATLFNHYIIDLFNKLEDEKQRHLIFQGIIESLKTK